MEILAGQIKRQLEIRNGIRHGMDHCAIGEEELQRIWPKRDGSRKKDRAVREGLRIAFDVVQPRDVRDLRKETARMIPL